MKAGTIVRNNNSGAVGRVLNKPHHPEYVVVEYFSSGIKHKKFVPAIRRVRAWYRGNVEVVKCEKSVKV